MQHSAVHLLSLAIVQRGNIIYFGKNNHLPCLLYINVGSENTLWYRIMILSLESLYMSIYHCLIIPPHTAWRTRSESGASLP